MSNVREYTVEELQRFIDALDLTEYLSEQGVLLQALDILLREGVIDYPDWL